MCVCVCVCVCTQLLLSNDASQWDRALQMPHYSAKAMPAVSMDAVLHMTQCARSGHFRLFDYGSAADNVRVYGQPTPPDVAEEYWRFGEWDRHTHTHTHADTHTHRQM